MSAEDRGILEGSVLLQSHLTDSPYQVGVYESKNPQGASPWGFLFALSRFAWYHVKMGTNGELDVLTQLLVDDKIKGMSYLAIAQKHSLPVEEVIEIVRAYYTATTIRDPQEHRALLQLRLERIIEKLWEGLEAGSFKHGEAIIKAVTQLQELHDLNEKTMTVTVNLMEDEDTDRVLEVLKRSSNSLRDKVARLPLSAKAKEELKAWPEWAAEAATEAVEEVIYAEIED